MTKLDFTALRNLKENIISVVYGDQSLDRNSIGYNSGWSRENSNIPVFSATEENFNPGGGGNLACNVQTFVDDVIVCGLWGGPADIYRKELERQFGKRDIKTFGMLEAERTGVFGKMYLRSGVHVARSDVALPKMNAEMTKLMRRKIEYVLGYGAKQILVADYDEVGMGICRSEILKMLTESRGTVTFGTSRLRIREMKDFDFLFLNEKELAGQVAEDYEGNDVKASVLMLATNANCLVLTLAGRGVAVYFTPDVFGLPDGTLRFHRLHPEGFDIAEVLVSSVPLKDVDPCGCGDTFMAAFSSAIMANYNVSQAASIGNAAARVVAGKKFGAAAPSMDEVEKEYVEIQKAFEVKA